MRDRSGAQHWRGEKLLGSGPLGLGGGIAAPATRFAPTGPYYRVNDAFTTNLAAGAVNGTASEPGPGGRTVIDTGNYVTVSGGKVVLAGGGSTWGTSVLYYVEEGRPPGLVMVAEVTFTNKLFAVVGFSSNSVGLGSATENVQIYFRDVLRFWGGNIGYNYGAYSTGVSYIVACVLRATGGFLFIKNYTGAYWTLLEIFNVGTASCDPQINAYNATLTSDYIRVPSTLWLPTPIISDGFGAAFGATDGLGHAEGLAGGLGAGGSGLAWSQVGTWANGGGVANASALSGGSAIAYIASGKADVIATVKFTRSGGDGGLLLRFVDGNNFVTCRHDGTNVILVKKVAGANTTVQTTAATYVAGAELRVTCEATKFRVYYNNAFIGSEQTISDAGLQSGANHGLYTTNTGNTFDDFVVRARGTGGEYAALDGF